MSRAAFSNSPGVLVYLSTGEETAVQLFAQDCIHSRTEAPLLLRFMCIYLSDLNFQPGSYPDVK